MGREASLELFKKMGFLDENGNLLPEVAAKLKSIPQGAATTVWCATSPLLDNIGGVYCENNDIAPLSNGADSVGSYGVELYALDETNSKRLWDLSEKMTDISFQFS
ncbi:oxidoreductase [compost metagenome]